MTPSCSPGLDGLHADAGHLPPEDTALPRTATGGQGDALQDPDRPAGSNSVAGPTMSSLGGQFGLQGMITKMLACISDARIGQRTDKTAVVERLLSISGEDAISVQRKFLTDWFGRLPTRMQILTSELPALTEGSGALANRYIVLTFCTASSVARTPA